MLISPTEPRAIRDAGTVSPKPEQLGADLAWWSRPLGGWVGVQRKEVSDLLASVVDGRLGEQVAKMRQACSLAVVLVEGRVDFTTDGLVVSKGHRGRGTFRKGMNKYQWWGVLWSVREKGLWVDHVSGMNETIEWCRAFEAWTRKPEHTSLDVRKKARDETGWGFVTNEDWSRYMVQGIPGVGVGLARRIVERWGLPFTLTIGVEQLMEVEGIGKKKAEAIVKAFQLPVISTSSESPVTKASGE